MKNVNELIQDIVPYVDENFITFPLTEEGDYRPHIKFWKIYDIVDFKLPIDADDANYNYIKLTNGVSLSYTIRRYGHRDIGSIKDAVEKLGGVGPFLVDLLSGRHIISNYKYHVDYTLYCDEDPTLSSDFDLEFMLGLANKILVEL